MNKLNILILEVTDIILNSETLDMFLALAFTYGVS